MTPEKLIKHALTAQNRAAAPYSQYQVGSAIVTEDNTVILGCNVESKAYPTTLCAERVAIFSAMALVTEDGAFPCGSCRQIIHEYAGNIPIYISNGSNEYITQTISDLLPNPFG